MKRKRRFSETAIKEHILNYERSGQKVSEYCKGHGLVRPTFYAWLKRFKSVAPQNLKINGNFIPLSMSSEKEASEYFAEVAYPNGKVVRFFSSVNTSVLLALLK